MQPLEGKVAFVTGASGEIGAATARTFVAGGARVFLVDLHEQALASLSGELGSAAAYCGCDVTDEGAMARAVAAAKSKFERIDIAVLNAGIEGEVAPIGEGKLADFDRVLKVNVRGVFIGLAAIMPLMKKGGGGAITILSSTAGRRGTPGMAPYITSKHAVVGLMKVAALEGAKDGIRVNTINPGPIETRMMRSIEQNFTPDDPDGMKQKFSAAIPLGRYGTAQEVADFIAFLSSDKASYCTGNIYGVDGGLTA